MLTGSSDHTRGWDCVGFAFESRLICRHDREVVMGGGEGMGEEGGRKEGRGWGRRWRGRKRKERKRKGKKEGGKRGMKSKGDLLCNRST